MMQKLQFKQAAVLHFDVCALTVGVGADAGGQIDDAKTAEQVGEFAFVGNDFGDAGERGDFIGRAGGVAAHHDDPRARDCGQRVGGWFGDFWNRLRA